MKPNIFFAHLVLYFFMGTLALHASDAKRHVFPINQGWEFRQVREGNWHPANVPGNVHTDLMACHLIADPYIALNERGVQWVDKEDWEYKTHFDVPEQQRNDSHKSLVFHGIDTYADVFLNDSLILEADNMFRTWTVDVEGLLLPRDNELRVYFHSPIKIDLPKFEALDYRYEASNDQSENGGLLDRKLSPFARKAGYHYGWDWGPRLVTSGIWRPVELFTWSDLRIADVYVHQETNAKVAKLCETVTIESDTDCVSQINVTDATTGRKLATKQVQLHKGTGTYQLDFAIRNPKLWWTNGLGEAHLYNFRTEVVANHASDVSDVRIGLRSIRLVNEMDSLGRGFRLELNGKPLFMKGANYIPSDIFLPRVTDSIRAQTIADAVAVHMNMIRIWGGGIYEEDNFYDLCDENGILVWQDFMFACAIYPASGQLYESIKAEAEDNVRRLRNHACIGLWCGGNECHEAYYGWWWDRYQKLPKEQSELVDKEFRDLYFKLLPETVEANAPGSIYWPASPYGEPHSWARPTQGDCHFWDVWAGGQPISRYNEVRSHFFSEYGMQSFPELETIRMFLPDSTQWDIRSDMMMAHQRGGSTANTRIERYLQDGYGKPANFKSLLYMGQLMQGDAMKTAVEAHRRDKGFCWGTLYWQINDCWPVASWSSRDWYGRWKASHYLMRRAMDDILVSPIEKDSTMYVYVINDRLSPVRGTLDVRLMSLDGEVLRTFTQRVTVAANASCVAFAKPTSQVCEGADKRKVVLTAEFKADRVYGSDYRLLPDKDVQWPVPHIDWDVETMPDGSSVLTLKSDVYVRALYLCVPGRINPFADNYFNLLPNETRRVPMRMSISKAELQEKLQLTCLNSCERMEQK